MQFSGSAIFFELKTKNCSTYLPTHLPEHRGFLDLEMAGYALSLVVLTRITRSLKRKTLNSKLLFRRNLFGPSTTNLADKKLLEPFNYILQVPGKNIRSKLAKAFNHWLRIPDEKLNQITEIVQILHNSSLLIDDIQDNSILRRGIPVAHSIYGVASTINTANYTSFIALERVEDLKHPEAISIALEQILELYRGQGMEIYWRDNLFCPSEHEYKQMVVRKTGGLFMLAIRLMQLFSENREDYTKIAAILGLIFQIRDDYMNLFSIDYMQHKSYCEDLTEGKFSFPIIHAIVSQPQDKQVMHILRQRTKETEVKKYCVSLLEKYGSFEYTRQTLNELNKDAKAEIEKLGGNPYMEEFLSSLAKF